MLTDTKVKNLKTKNKTLIKLDGQGLKLYVGVGGTKTWVHRYTINKQQKTTTLGHYPTMSLAEARQARDKNKRVYARCHFEDRTGIVDLTVYSSLYETTSELVASDSILLVGGRVREKSDGVREIIADRIMHVDQAMSQLTASINLEIDLDTATDETLKILTELLEVRPVINENGDSPVQVPLYIETIREGKRWVIKSGNYSVALDLEMLRKLRTVASGDGVLLKSGLQAPPPKRARYNNRRGN